MAKIWPSNSTENQSLEYITIMEMLKLHNVLIATIKKLALRWVMFLPTLNWFVAFSFTFCLRKPSHGIDSYSAVAVLGVKYPKTTLHFKTHKAYFKNSVHTVYNIVASSDQ